MKKIMTVFLIAVLLAAVFGRNEAKAAEFQLNYAVSAAMLVEYETGKVIFSYNEDKRVPIASITKIMTLILAFEAIESGKISYDEKITVSAEASAMGGSGVYLATGEEVSVEDLFKSIIVASANDACVAMAETLSGSQAQFVIRMNEKAKELGMNDTNFVNCTGLPSEGYYCTAHDVVIMARELMKHEDYFRWSTIWLDTVDGIQNKTVITNTNKLVRFYKGCDGTKTGFTNDAMHCVAASAKRNGVRYLAVVLGARSSDERFSLAKELLNFGFANYKTKTVAEAGESFEGSKDLSVILGKEDALTGVMAQNVTDFIEITEKHEYTVTSVPDRLIKAPVNEGDIIGYFIVMKDNEELMRVDMLADRTIEKLDLKSYMQRFFCRWLTFE